MGKTHWSGPLLSDTKSLGGAAEEMDISATFGESDMVTVFDDFNDVMPASGFSEAAAADGTTNLMEECGWVLTEDAGVTSVADSVTMNDPGIVADTFQSSLRIYPGTADDAGGNMQLDGVNDITAGVAYLGSATVDLVIAGHRNFPHIWIPETAAGATVLDNTVWTFGCRLGLRADITTTDSGDWEGKMFIGWAEAGDTSLLTHDTGAITITSGGPLVGFHVGETGIINGVSHRTVATAMAEGTNQTALGAAGMVDGTVANGSTTAGDTAWFDLALRMTISDMSDDDANGATEFYWRKVNPTTGSPGSGTQNINGWAKHGTVLSNQTPNNDVALVPTIEVINGPTAGTDCVAFLDWWTFGCSRHSRK